VKRAYKLRKRIRFGRKMVEKRYGKKLKCIECGKVYFTNDTTLKKRKQFELCQECVNIGSRHGRWKGGRLVRCGYVLLWVPEHNNSDIKGYIKEHRYKMSIYLKRDLKEKEVVHHINGDRADNRLSNLILCKNNAEHSRIHKKQREMLRESNDRN
jgi:hypothetical protein